MTDYTAKDTAGYRASSTSPRVDTAISIPEKKNVEVSDDDDTDLEMDDDNKDNTGDEEEARNLEDDLLSPLNSEIGSDEDGAVMEQDLEDNGLIRKVGLGCVIHLHPDRHDDG
jgi:hypothetical protein